MKDEEVRPKGRKDFVKKDDFPELILQLETWHAFHYCYIYL